MNSADPGTAGKDPPATLAEEIAPAVEELAREGHGRNAISRALAVSTATVSRAAAIAGVEFDRGPTEVATRTRAEQLAEDRAELAAMSAEIARRAGRRLYMELGAEVLDASAVTALNRAYGTATDKALAAGMLAPDDTQDDEYRMARVWVEGLQAQITAHKLGIIPPNADGNHPMILSADQIPQDQDDQTTTSTTNPQEGT